MSFLAFEFFFRLLWGWNLFLLLISRHESSEKFLRVSFRFSTGFTLVATLAALSSPLGPSKAEYAVLFAVWLGAGLYLSVRQTWMRVAGVSLVLLSPLALLGVKSPLLWLNMLLAALALGGAFGGQFLGHWFLNVPNIHIKEFKRVTQAAVASIVLRFAMVLLLALTFQQSNELASGEAFALKGDGFLGLGSFGLILFASRIMWGLVAPLILTIMAKKTVAMRATQSATGIFYANSVLLMLGELTALYLEKELQWPV